MIYTGENKAVLCKGDFHPAQLYKGDKKITGYTETEFEGAGGMTGDHVGAPLLENCYNDKIYDVQIRSKNLIDVNKYYGEWANENGGISIPNSGVLYSISSFFINVTGVFKENTQYTFSCKYNLIEATTGIQPQITHMDGTRNYVTIGANTPIGEGTVRITSSPGKTVKSFSFTYGTTSKTFNAELTNMQIEEGATATEYESPCRDATITIKSMENTEKTETIPFENGELTSDIPTFKGTTVIEIESDIAATISGKYKRME